MFLRRSTSECFNKEHCSSLDSVATLIQNVCNCETKPTWYDWEPYRETRACVGPQYYTSIIKKSYICRNNIFLYVSKKFKHISTTSDRFSCHSRVIHPVNMAIGIAMSTVLFAIFWYVTNESISAGNFKRKHPIISIGLIITGIYLVMSALDSMLVFFLGILLPLAGTRLRQWTADVVDSRSCYFSCQLSRRSLHTHFVCSSFRTFIPEAEESEEQTHQPGRDAQPQANTDGDVPQGIRNATGYILIACVMETGAYVFVRLHMHLKQSSVSCFTIENCIGKADHELVLLCVCGERMLFCCLLTRDIYFVTGATAIFG